LLYNEKINTLAPFLSFYFLPGVDLQLSCYCSYGAEDPDTVETLNQFPSTHKSPDTLTCNKVNPCLLLARFSVLDIIGDIQAVRILKDKAELVFTQAGLHLFCFSQVRTTVLMILKHNLAFG
jgi:hypothetical protein